MERALIYKASMAFGIVGIIAALSILMMVNGAIDGIGSSAHKALSSVNSTVGSFGRAMDGAEGLVNSSGRSLDSLGSAIGPLSDGLAAAGDSLDAVSGAVSIIPGGSLAVGGLAGSAASLRSSSEAIARTGGAIGASGKSLSELRVAIAGLRQQEESAEAAIADAGISLDESLDRLRLASLLFFLMNASLSMMQILNAYAGLKSP
ncbi:MAG: hypothetical protein U0R44_03015 [Candidatus Micrarchaeia archaeon]